MAAVQVGFLVMLGFLARCALDVVVEWWQSRRERLEQERRYRDICADCKL